ncbi:DUF6049 family protein [Nocardioides sp.]|uniref:DUF6049 family protein n=1 Tax=Nocardioides sp. TaxID=35761 RepID=UPI003D0CDECB
MTGRVRQRVAHAATPLPVRLVPLILVTSVVASLLSLSPGVGPARAESGSPAEVTDPLKVTISGVAPAVIPKKGPLRLSGTVTNVSEETWSLINVYTWVADQPITTADDLDANAQSDPFQQLGQRIVEPETDLRIDELAPGQSTSYSVSVPHDILIRYLDPSAPGVYRIGVQTLGASTDGRPETAVGRAYTYVPLVSPDASDVQAAVVLPIRREVTYTHEGKVRDLPRWRRDLGPAGGLHNLLDFGSSAPPGTLTWLIDPAVLEAVQRLADGNPVRDLGPISEVPPDTTASPDPTPAADEDADGEDSGAAASAAALDETSRLATEWLAQLATATTGSRVLSLPYGDVDMAAANTVDPQVAKRATALSATVFQDLGIAADPAVAPPSGYLEPASVAALDTNATILASDAVLADPDLKVDPRSTTVLVNAHRVDLYDEAASSGGPGPTRPLSEVALRQRVLSEAALRSQQQDPRPLVIALPADWNPGGVRAGFFDALDRSWLSVVPQQSLGDPDPPTVTADSLVYPERQAERELGIANFDAAIRLAQAGATLQNLLTDNTTVEREVLAQALTTTSYFMRGDPQAAIDDADRARRSIEAVFNQVHISAPESVTLSGASGPVRVDLRNDLEQTVTLRIEPIADQYISIRTPGKIKLEGGTSTSVRLRVRSTQLGLHQVRLALVDDDGTRLGPGADLPIRSNQSGRVIWVIIAAGMALLFGAIALRLVRRFTGRHSHGDQG